MSVAPINSALLAPGLAPQATPVTHARPITDPSGSQRAGATPPGPTFAELLAAQAREPAESVAAPRFSRHALDRLQQRGIDLAPQTLERLTSGIAQAAAKGSRDSVVFIDGTAFVTSVKNNTVITAVDPGHMREHVFTNIDSAVFA